MDVENLSKYSIGSDVHTAAMSFAAGAPLDDRFVVRSKESLISKKVFEKFGYLYSGLVVTVSNTGTAYVLKTDTTKPANDFLKDDSWFTNASDLDILDIIDANWVKLASDSDLKNIKSVVSGIFQFKGIATAIDPDHTSLTVGYGDITVDGEETPLISWGTSSKNIFNQVMYAWGTKDGVLTYTEEPYIADPRVEDLRFFKRKLEADSQYIEVFGSIYVDNSNTVNDFKEWADSLGNIVYTKVNSSDPTVLDVYPTSNSAGSAVATVLPFDYTYWIFEENTDFKQNYSYNADSSLLQVPASQENNGHVYQLGEEEYASNGQMWVQLGSPKTDWIVL